LELPLEDLACHCELINVRGQWPMADGNQMLRLEACAMRRQLIGFSLTLVPTVLYSNMSNQTDDHH
jgi:hypothetical protein